METVVTTAVEMQSDANGVIQIVDEERMVEEAPNPLVNGINADHQLQPQPQQQQQQEQQQATLPKSQAPILFDMDLERMHVDLYKGKYLTPQEFLEDVEKIVHNAGVMVHEDTDRLYKAQAMLTAAEVSIHEFDAGLRIECERMASRERRRREEHRKQKDKERGKPDAAAQPVGTRRSARHNGQQPELKITDPLQLERKLKRQRSNEDVVMTPELSEDHGDEREAKRSKMSVSDDGDRDPLDLLGPGPLPRQPTVRFAADFPPVPNEHGGQFMNGISHYAQGMPPSPVPTKTAGFDSSLLNPAPGNLSPPPYFDGPPLPSLLQTFASTSSFTPNEMFPPIPTPENQANIYTPIPQTFAPQTPLLADDTLPPTTQPMPELEPTPNPMVVERTPTPPPEFHVNQDLVYSLKTELRDSTGLLTVEQLEQLRATCLGSVWRHRTEWNRDALVHELMDTVKEFVSEVNEDMESFSP